MIYLTKIDPSRNMVRFYVLDVQRTLFGEWSLIREWGRIGSAGQGRCVSYPAESAARLALERELQRRTCRQYRTIAASVAV